MFTSLDSVATGSPKVLNFGGSMIQPMQIWADNLILIGANSHSCSIDALNAGASSMPVTRSPGSINSLK
jgi:hypothetical protein